MCGAAAAGGRCMDEGPGGARAVAYSCVGDGGRLTPAFYSLQSAPCTAATSPRQACLFEPALAAGVALWDGTLQADVAADSAEASRRRSFLQVPAERQKHFLSTIVFQLKRKSFPIG